MLSACFTGALPTFQIRVFFYHVGVKIVLPLCQVCPVAADFFCTQPVILRQRHKGQMQVGRFLVHVYHGRDDILPAYPPYEEIRRPLEKGGNLLCGLAFEELRACCDEGIHKPGAVFPCPAPGLFNALLNEMVVSALRLDDMEVISAPACVNVRVTGVLFLLSFVVGFQRPCRVTLMLRKA